LRVEAYLFKEARHVRFHLPQAGGRRADVQGRDHVLRPRHGRLRDESQEL